VNLIEDIENADDLGEIIEGLRISAYKLDAVICDIVENAQPFAIKDLEPGK
jgi:hypothetical protein